MSEMMLAQDSSAIYYPSMELAKKLFLFEADSKKGLKSDKLEQEILGDIKDNKMVALYQQLASKYSWIVDQSLIDTMTKENEESLVGLDKKIADAVEIGGDVEVLDALFAKARFYSKTGAWTAAVTVYDEILAKPKSSTGKKIDSIMEKARIAFFDLDINKVKELITEAKKLADIGGDWDRRNRLKVYEAISMLITRDFKESAALFIDGISTFSCVELCSYDEFIFYAVVICIVSVPRTDLYKKIICNPQIISVIRTQPELQNLLQSLYRCDYKTFFESLTYVFASVSTDRYLSPHVRYLMKEFRILAYAQFLEAYKSVLMTSMADQFGLSLALLDQELSHFISVGRLTAKIDKVGGIVVSSRADTKNAQYHEAIKKGDALLNQIQKLVRVIDV